MARPCEAITSCWRGILGKSRKLAPRGPPKTNNDIPVSGAVINPCNGEIVTFGGVDHFTARLTILAIPLL